MVLASGCFDGLHAGHVAYLQAAKSLCLDEEPFLITIAPDRYIRAQKHREPSWPQDQRYATVEALAIGLRSVVRQSDEMAAEIERLKPRLFVKGVDWAGRLPQDVVAACQAVECLIVFVQTPGRHTSEASAVAVKNDRQYADDFYE